MSATRPRSTTGLRRFLDLEQQRDWMQGKTILGDTAKRLVANRRFDMITSPRALLRLHVRSHDPYPLPVFSFLLRQMGCLGPAQGPRYGLPC